MYFLIQIAFQSSDRVELDFWGSVIKNAFNFKSRGTEKVELSSQGPTSFKFWKWNSYYCWLQLCKNFQVCCIGYKVIAKIITFCINFELSTEWIWMNIKNHFCLSCHFLPAIALYPTQQNWISHLKFFGVVGPLGENLDFFSPLGFDV